MDGKKYGLILRVSKSQQKQQVSRPPVPKPAGFNDEDDDDVEREISRQAVKNKSLKDVEQQHKKALQEDPSVFDYDGVYDDMKAKVAQPRAQDHQKRQPKYIQGLIDKAKQREREHEIVYERKLAKERIKDDHLFSDKDKFVTGSYKRKLAEQEKWMEEQRLRELREAKDDVTKKSDLTDFYFNLSKNVAYGAAEKSESKKTERPEKEPVATTNEELKKPERSEKESGERRQPSMTSPSRLEDKSLQPERSPVHTSTPKPTPEEQPEGQPKKDHHKKGEDAIASAKERFLARKRAKTQ